MSDNDAFNRAVRALRETGETSAADAARARMRVMETLHRGERRGRRTLWVLLPIAAVLAGSTALAKNPELARRVWSGVAETVGIVGPSEKAAATRPVTGRGARRESDLSAPPANESPNALSDNAAPAENVAPAENAPPAENAAPAENSVPGVNAAPGEKTASPGEPRAARETSPAVPRRNRRPEADHAAAPDLPNPNSQTVEPETAPSAAAVNDGEAASLALYKQAYRLHFVEQRYAAALAAWDEYLRAAPTGRLVVEARYNRGIALARLGRRAEAETALRPFARGEVSGGYRAREARELLDALNGSSR